MKKASIEVVAFLLKAVIVCVAAYFLFKLIDKAANLQAGHQFKNQCMIAVVGNPALTSYLTAKDKTKSAVIPNYKSAVELCKEWGI